MSYEDVDEIKEKLHNAYMAACHMIGENHLITVVQVAAFESDDMTFYIQIEKDVK